MIDFDYRATLDFSVPWKYRWQLLSGLWVSFCLMWVSSVAGLAIGIVLAMVSRTRHAVIRWMIAAYVEFFRNTPLLVQLIWLHFVLPLLTGINTTPLVSGILALTLNVTAYFSEIARAGINSVGRGQWEGAWALGLQTFATWVRVSLPQALRVMVPPLAGMVINIFKATAILSILAIDDLMRVATRISNSTFKPVEMITAAAVLYLVLGSLLALGADWVERKYGPRRKSA